MQATRGLCGWRNFTKLTAISLIIWTASANAAVRPVDNQTGAASGSVKTPAVVARSLMQFEHFGTTSPADLYSQFAEGNALRGTGMCLPDLPCTGTPEGEPDCTVAIGQPPPDDQFNSGCNAIPPAFSPISCGETVCGEAWFLSDGEDVSRDTDWWIFHLDQQSLMTWSVTSEFIQTIGILDRDDGLCPVAAFFNATVTGACTNGTVQECLAPGTYMLFVGPNFGANTGLTYSCRRYTATLTCQPSCILACCVGETCVETDSFDCVQTQSGINFGVGSDCSNPQVCTGICFSGTLIACGGQVAIDNTTNTTLPNPLFTCAGGTGQIGAEWFQFTATSDSVYVATCASNPALGDDSTIAVYSGACNFISLTEIGCGEDEGCGDPNTPWLSEICVGGLTVGDTYFIQFAAWDASARGQYLLDVVCPCPELAPGPCCLPNGSCEILSETACTAAGGQHQGPEQPGVFDCDNGDACVDGACCDGVGGCVFSTGTQCAMLGGTILLGETCTSGDGFTANPCDGTCCIEVAPFNCSNTDEISCANTWYADEACNTNFWACPRSFCAIDIPANCQSPALESVFGPGVVVPGGGTIASSSDSNPIFTDPANPGTLVGTADMDDFIPLATPIDEVCWWGMYADLSAGAPDNGRCQANDAFTITIFNDDGSACPIAPPIASEAVTRLRSTTGDRVTANLNLVYQYNADIAPVAVVPGQCYWIAITNNTDDGSGTQTCRWMWVTAPLTEGNGSSIGTFTNDPTAQPACNDSNACNPWDYAFCLNVANDPCGLSCTACAVQAVRSCKDHGALNRLCLDLATSNVEPRSGGATSIEIDIDAGTATSATVTCVNSGTYGGVATVSQAGNTVTVDLSPALPDQDTCTITLDCGATVCVRSLAGDIDRNGVVSTGDASIIKPHFGEAAMIAGAEFDFDENGIVSTGDASTVKPLFGNTAPACP